MPVIGDFKRRSRRSAYKIAKFVAGLRPIEMAFPQKKGIFICLQGAPVCNIFLSQIIAVFAFWDYSRF